MYQRTPTTVRTLAFGFATFFATPWCQLPPQSSLPWRRWLFALLK